MSWFHTGEAGFLPTNLPVSTAETWSKLRFYTALPLSRLGPRPAMRNDMPRAIIDDCIMFLYKTSGCGAQLTPEWIVSI